MYYTIGQVAERYQLPVSTLRYYDKEGLFPHLKREGNIRKFSDIELEELRIIECLKQSGLEIKDIKQFFQWVAQGDTTYENRRQLFEHRMAVVEQEIQNLQRTLAMLKFKCWYYETALADGGEEHLNEMIPDHLPPEVQQWYDHAHERGDWKCDGPAPADTSRRPEKN